MWGIVADGRDRARRASEPLVRAEVEREYAARLRETPPWDHWMVRRDIDEEVRRRLDRLAPPDALY